MSFDPGFEGLFENVLYFYVLDFCINLLINRSLINLLKIKILFFKVKKSLNFQRIFFIPGFSPRESAPVVKCRSQYIYIYIDI